MDYQTAAENLKKAVNPNYGQMPAEQLVQRIRQSQFANLDSQSRSIDDTKRQLAQMRANPQEKPFMDTMKWGLLADMFSPEGGTNFAQTAAAIQPRDTRSEDLYNLQRQLTNQEKTLASSLGDIDLGEAAPENVQIQLENLRHNNRKEYLKLQNQLKGEAEGAREEKPKELTQNMILKINEGNAIPQLSLIHI